MRVYTHSRHQAKLALHRSALEKHAALQSIEAIEAASPLARGPMQVEAVMEATGRLGVAQVTCHLDSSLSLLWTVAVESGCVMIKHVLNTCHTL
jgi:hypothetical protein